MSKAKQKGTAWETECVRYLESYTKHEFMRLPLVGTKDVGTSVALTYLILYLNAKTGMMPSRPFPKL